LIALNLGFRRERGPVRGSGLSAGVALFPLVPGRAFLYVGDVFRLLQLSLKELLEAWEGDRLALFELVRGEVERELGEVRGVRLVGAFLDPSSMTAVVEYLVGLAGGGEASVKVVHAEDSGGSNSSASTLRHRFCNP